ncbi:MAG: hypothetical protein A2Y33_06125 [Spirochaetes bacterium GWF1_51_8]|nr:MAG: hypothetical protein A2Y33_06125 [Spirochaetes bacterium GWF1_51_8]
MKDNYFLDSSVILYAIGDETEKKMKSVSLLQGQPFLSTQVISEISNVMNRKLKMTYSDIASITNKIVQNSNLVLIDYHTIQSAYRLAERYSFSYYDSLIIASAIENFCSVLYTEDLNNNQKIEGNLRIINPFIF